MSLLVADRFTYGGQGYKLSLVMLDVNFHSLLIFLPLEKERYRWQQKKSQVCLIKLFIINFMLIFFAFSFVPSST